MVTPALVLLAWCLNQPLTLAFPPFQSVAIFVAVFVVNSLIVDGEVCILKILAFADLRKNTVECFLRQIQ